MTGTLRQTTMMVQRNCPAIAGKGWELPLSSRVWEARVKSRFGIKQRQLLVRYIRCVAIDTLTSRGTLQLTSRHCRWLWAELRAWSILQTPLTLQSGTWFNSISCPRTIQPPNLPLPHRAWSWMEVLTRGSCLIPTTTSILPRWWCFRWLPQILSGCIAVKKVTVERVWCSA